MLWGASCEGSSRSLGLVTNWQELQLCVLFLPGLFGAQTIKCLSVSWVLWIITVQGLSKKLAHLVLDKGASHQAPSSLSSGQSWSKAKGMALILKGFRICRPSCFAWALRMSCPSVPRRSVFSQQTLSHTCTLPSTIQFSRSVVSDSLWPRGLQHARLPCPSLTPGAYSNSCPSSRWCHPTISSSVVPFSSCPQSLPASESFPMSQFFTSGGQSIGVSPSASVLSMNIQDWFPLDRLGGFPCSPRDSRVFSNTTVQKHQFFSAQSSL